MNTIFLVDNRSFLRKLRDYYQLWKHRTFHNHKDCENKEKLLKYYQKDTCLEVYSDNITSLQSDFFTNFNKYVCKNCIKRFSCSCNTDIDPEEDYVPYWCFACKQLTIFADIFVEICKKI